MTEAIIIDTPEGIAHWQMARMIAAIKLEVTTGMKATRGSVLRAVESQYGIKARTKKKALEEMKKLYRETYGREYGK